MENNEQSKEEATSGNATETTNANSNVGQPQEIDVLNEAKRITEEMKRQNEIKAKLLDREEKNIARQETLRALGGGSPAGQIPAKPAKMTPMEYRLAIERGEIPPPTKN